MTTPLAMGLSLDQAEREIHRHIFGRDSAGGSAGRVARVGAALALLGDPHAELRVIHITGTNGKTSTSRMIESLLRAQGLSTGLFTSPHLTTLRERIRINGESLDQAALVRLWHHVAPAIHRVDTESLHHGEVRMSFFEVLTVLGLVAFADAGVEAAIVEVGIGGTHDATNVVQGTVAVFTPIACDHENIMGGGLPGIATEKSGIIKPGCAVVSASQTEEVAVILTETAGAKSASTFWEGPHMSVESSSLLSVGQRLTLRTAAATYHDVDVPLHGSFQAQNALTALAACEVFVGEGIPRSLARAVVDAGFAAATSPGRMEVAGHDPLVILDAGHNPHGIAALGSAISQTFAQPRWVAVVAVLEDKDAHGMFTSLDPLVERVVVTRTSSPRAIPVDDLALTARMVMGPDRVDQAPTVALALAMARDLAVAGSGPAGAVLVAGSVTLVGEARTHLRLGLGAGDVAAESVPL